MKQLFKIAVIALAMVCSFSQTTDAKVKKTKSTKTQTTAKQSKGSWQVTSASDLKKHIAGTVWTCCSPNDDMMYRLEFRSDHMLLKYTSNPPIKKEWSGGGKEADKWRYEIVDGSDCVQVMFYKMNQNDSFCFGSLNFYRNGKVYFNWLRGRHGGPATYGEYNWK